MQSQGSQRCKSFKFPADVTQDVAKFLRLSKVAWEELIEETKDLAEIELAGQLKSSASSVSTVLLLIRPSWKASIYTDKAAKMPMNLISGSSCKLS